MKERDGVEALGEVAWDVLQRIVRELLARKPGGHLVEAELDELDLRLPLALSGPSADPRRFAESVVGSIDRILDDAVQSAAAFRPGRAYCHRCESAECDHSEPPGSRHVFTGYTPTGTPRWEDFAQLCLERKHPEVDRLYREPPVLLTLVHRKEELQGGMLRAFRNGSYELLGQVTAGFFAVPTRAEEGRGVVALTMQAAGSRRNNGTLLIGLNLLGRAPGGEGLHLLWERQDDLPWRRAVRWAQSALASLPRRGRSSHGREGTAKTEGARLEERVVGILNGLARRLERDHRARSRRTRHAEERHVSGKRPTRKAVDDARDAEIEACLIDERSGTVVVLGDRGRTHFFTPNGQLVSSVRYSKDAIARKIKLELWRRASPEDVASLRRSLTD